MCDVCEGGGEMGLEIFFIYKVKKKMFCMSKLF